MKLEEPRRVEGAPPPLAERKKLLAALVRSEIMNAPVDETTVCALCHATVSYDTTFGTAVGVLCAPCFQKRRAEQASGGR